MTLKGFLYYIRNPQKIYGFFSTRGLLNWMSDEAYIKTTYRINTGKKLELEKLTSFSDKLRWIKLYDRKPVYTELVDKYAVRKYAAKVLGEDHLIPLVGGPWKSFDEIDFDALPEQFVLKCTHDSGGLVICRDKAKLDKNAARKKIKKSLKTNYYYLGREWPYKNVPPRIIAEAYMEDENRVAGLTDYKFFCFNGEPRMIYVSQGLENHSTARISFYDLEGKEMPFRRSDYRPIEGEMVFPSNFSEMTKAAKELAQMVDCPFVRIDLYSIRGKMYFSEVTFFPCSGSMPLDPPEWDEKLGEWIELPSK